jgi:hypothetical protein
MIAKELKFNRTLLELFLVRRFYYYNVLDVYDEKGVFEWF